MTRHDEFLELQAQDTDDCVLWPHSKTGGGYGHLKVGRQVLYTHRLSVEIAHGPPPFAGAQAAHLCRNRDCMNPRHLRWASAKENAADRVQDGTDPRGERCGNAKLTEFDVTAIRHYAKCGTKHGVLADHYGISTPYISGIVNHKTWTHLEGVA